MDTEKVILGFVALLGAIGTFSQGILTWRENRAKRMADDRRAERTDVVAVLSKELDYARNQFKEANCRCDELQVKVDALQKELWERTAETERVTDLAQAALLKLSAYEQQRGGTTSGNR